MSYDCQQPFSLCGTCAGCHRTPDCNNHNGLRCMSCKVEGHCKEYAFLLLMAAILYDSCIVRYIIPLLYMQQWCLSFILYE